jgi:hypothetical protein
LIMSGCHCCSMLTVNRIIRGLAPGRNYKSEVSSALVASSRF